jgi:hypothetical protein
MQALRDFLEVLPAGPVENSTLLENLLADAWQGLSGGREAGMEGYKILHRAESMCWNPPCLTFTIERHGGTVMGSTRAGLQDWSVNVSARTAERSSRRGVVN